MINFYLFTKSVKSRIIKTAFLLGFPLLMSQVLYAQLTYYSKAGATDFASTASWGVNLDGSGAAPASISSANNFTLTNGSNMVLNANASVRRLDIVGGTLTVAANTLTVAITGQNNTELTIGNGGNFTVTGGTVNLNGSLRTSTGSFFAQSGGNINVDPNNGGNAATSYPGAGIYFGTSILTSANSVSLTGGTLTMVDPSVGDIYSFILDGYINGTDGGVFNNITSGHTFRFGNGVSTDPTNGTFPYDFLINTWAGFVGMTFGNVEVNRSTVSGFAAFTPLLVLGNLTVNPGGRLTCRNVNGSNVAIRGNIVNNGTLEMGNALRFSQPVISTAAALSDAFFSSPQSVSGTGTFRNTEPPTAPTANYTSVISLNTTPGGVSFSSPQSLLSTLAYNGTVSFQLLINAGCRINTNGGTFTLGISAVSPGTLTLGTSGLGFTSNSIFRRWVSTSTISAATPATAVFFPFMDGEFSRNVLLNSSTGSITSGGWIQASHSNTSGLATVAFTDAGYNVERRTNAGWTFTTGAGLSLGAATLNLGLTGEGLLPLLAAPGTAPRLVQSAGAIQTHSAGGGTTVAPIARRQGLTAANLANTHHMGVQVADLALYSIASGPWESGATWSTGSAPTALSNPIISSGTTVTVNAAAAAATTVRVDPGGTLNVSGNTLTVSGGTFTGVNVAASGNLNISGGTLALSSSPNCNRVFNMAGNLNVSSGNLNVFGQFFMAAATSKITQSGGNIRVDANSGVAGTSITTVTPVVIQTQDPADINLTGGTFTVVDPNLNGTATNAFTMSTLNPGKIDIPATHTFRFGDGASLNNGGSATAGFRITAGSVLTTPLAASNFVEFGTVTILFAGGTNRFLNPTTRFLAKNLTVDVGAEFRQPATGTIPEVAIAGNLVVDGFATFPGNLLFARINSSGTYTSATGAQSISGSGTIQNLTSGATGQFTNLYVDNSGVGVTLNRPITVTGQLSLIRGAVNTTTTNILTMNTGLSGNVFVGASSAGYVNGPMRRTIPANLVLGSYSAILPVGKTGPNYISFSPATNAAGTVTITAEAQNSNAGTNDITLISLNALRRWDISTSGTGAITSYRATIFDNNLTNSSAVAGSATAAGTYSGLANLYDFASATAALPKSLTTGSDISGSLSPFFGFGQSNSPFSIGTIAVQQQTGNVAKSVPNNSLLRIAIPVAGALGSVALDQLVLTYTGTDPADIALGGVSLWTGNASTPFSQIGSGISLSGSTATFSGLNFDLSGAATYYFWIRLDIASTATVGNTVDGRIDAGGIVFTSTPPVTLSPPYPAAALDPAGSRLIDYCSVSYPAGNCPLDIITNVALNGSTINLANASTCPASTYTFYSAANKPDLQQGLTYTVSVTVGNDADQYVGVWVDFDRDGFFDSATEFFNNGGANLGANGTANINIVVPAGATLGNTRMRVRGGDDLPVPGTAACEASASTFGEAEDYIINIISPVGCASIGVWPAANTTSTFTSLCTGSSASFNLSAAIPSANGITYQLQLNGVDIGAATSVLPISSAITTTGTYRILVKCNGTPVVTPTGILVTALNPQVSTSAGATRCGAGTLTLTATPSAGASLRWYSDLSGGFELASGNSFVTPSLSVGTSTYYVGAQETFGVENIGQTTVTTPALTANTILVGMRFDATVPVKLNTVRIAAQTGASPVSIVVGIQNSSGAWIAETAPITLPANIVAGTLTTITLNLDVPAATGQRLLVKSFSGGTFNPIRNNAVGNAFVSSPSGVFSFTGSVNITPGFGNYSTFYDLQISRVCLSPRVAVNAEVTAPPPISLTGFTNSLCAGASQTITAGGSGYTTFNWSPGGAGTTKTVSPATTTTYTVTASGGGCNNSRAFTILIKPTPSNPVLSSVLPAGGICKGQSKTLVGSSSSTGGDYVVFRGDFNEGNTDGYQFQSSGSTPTNWQLATGPISYNADFVNFSLNGSPFIWVNSDVLGAGAGVARLVTPVISTVGFSGLSLRFTHAFRAANPGQTGTVQYSVDGGVTWSSDVYSTTTNLSVPFQSWVPTGFITTTTVVSLPAAVDNQSNVRIRFTYNYNWDKYWFLDDIELYTPAVNEYRWTSNSSFDGIPAPQSVFDPGNTTLVATPTEAGTYSITLTTRNNAGCNALATVSAASFNVSDVTIAPSNSGPQRSGQTVVFNTTASGGFSGYSYQWRKLPNPAVINSSASWSIPSAPSSSSGTYELTVTDGQGCSAVQTSELLVFDALVWNGSVSSDWNNPSNWTPNIVPNPATSCTDPIVDNVVTTNQGTPPVYPNTNQYLRSLVLESGSVTFTNNINVCGSLSGGSAASTATVGGAGTITLTGTGTTFVGGNLTLERLGIDKPSGQVRFQGSMSVRDLLSITPSSTGTITVEASGKLILASSATGTGKIGPVPAGIAFAVNAPGAIIQQRFTGPLPGTGRWMFLASPIQGKFFTDWADNFRITAMSPGVGGQGGDIFPTTNPQRVSLFSYNEATHNTYVDTVRRYGWSFPGATDQITPGRGYRVFVPTTGYQGRFDNAGNIFKGNINFSLTRNVFANCAVTATQTTACDELDRGWNLLGNPYPAPIDWDAAGWTKPAEMNNSFYTWNAIANQYRVYLGTSANGYSVGVNLGSKPLSTQINPNIIPSSQAFFVKLTSETSATLVATESVKSTTLNGQFSRNAVANEIMKVRMSTPLSSEQVFDAAIGLHDNATEGFDNNLDVFYLAGDNFGFRFVSGQGAELLMHSMPVPQESKTIPMIMKYSGLIGTFSLDFSDVNGFEGIGVFLKDNFTGSLTDVKASPVYSFWVLPNDASGNENRFELVINPESVTSTGKVVKGTTFTIYPNPVSGTSSVKLSFSGFKSGSGKVQVLDMVGRVVFEQPVAIQGNSLNEKLFDFGLPAGVYTVKVISSGKTITDKLVIR